MPRKMKPLFMFRDLYLSRLMFQEFSFLLVSGEGKTSKDLITIICDTKELNGKICPDIIVFEHFLKNFRTCGGLSNKEGSF